MRPCRRARMRTGAGIGQHVDHLIAGILPTPQLPGAGIGQHVDHLIRQRIRIKEIHRQSGFAMGDCLAHRRHIRGHDSGLHRH